MVNDSNEKGLSDMIYYVCQKPSSSAISDGSRLKSFFRRYHFCNFWITA